MKKEAKSNKKLKTFNLDESIYKQFSTHCKTNGISMSKKIENFIQEELQKLKTLPQSISKQKIISPKEHSFSKFC